jgi:phosphoribosylaminoimidazole-succinocarboxamide synthase
VPRVLRVGGTTKNLFEAEQAGMLIQQFKEPTNSRHDPDDVPSTETASHTTTVKTETGGKKPSVHISCLANEISSYVFKYLAGFRIPTHFVDKVSDGEMLVRQLAMIPLEVRIFNMATGEFARRFGMKEGSELTTAVLEHRFKNAALGSPLVNEFHIYSMNLATPEQLRTVNRLASKTNVVLKSFFERRELRLLGLSLEFGIAGNQIMLGDEISPRTCVLADLQRKDRPASDIFSDGNRHGVEAFVEVRNRIYRTFS